MIKDIEKDIITLSCELKKGEYSLEDRNLKLVQNLNYEDLENEFFKDEHGKIISRVNGTRCIAYAKK